MRVIEPRAERTHRSPAMLDDYVIAMLRAANHPLGAYDIARKSRQSGDPLAPNQVYRILDRLVARGDVQRVELLSAYVPSDGKRLGFMVCRSCHAVHGFAMNEVMEALGPLCASHEFTAETAVVEISGQCRDCADRPAGIARRRTSGGMRILLALLAAAGAASPAPPDTAAARETFLLPDGDGQRRTGPASQPMRIS